MHEPIRTLHVIDTLACGGAELSLLETLTRFDPVRLESRVCCIYADGPIREAFEQRGIPVYCLGIQGKYRFTAGIRSLGRLIRQLDSQVVHTSLFRASQIGRVAGWMARRPVVSTFTNTPYSTARRTWDRAAAGWKHQFLKRLDAVTARLVTRFHSVSQCVAVQNCADLGVASQKVQVIYRGRDLKKFRPADPQLLAAKRQELALGAGPVLLNVGRLVPQKGQLQLVTLMHSLQQDFPTATLLVAGDGPERDLLQAAVEKNGLASRVRLLGNRNDVPLLLQIADLFLFPSYYEGLPGAVVEAMLAGTPVVASDIAMHTELLDHGTHGTLFAHGDVGQLHNAVVSVLRHPQQARQMADAARVRAETQFDIQQIAQDMEQLFIDVVNNDLRRKTPLAAASRL